MRWRRWRFHLSALVLIVPLGFAPIKIGWFGDLNWALYVVAFIHAWKFGGIHMFVYLSGLKAIPHELVESARVDGAGPLRQFTDLTFPLLTPTLVMVGIMTLAGYFQLFAEPYVMTQGGPLRSTVSVLYFMYEEGFRWWNLGYASAVAFLLFLIVFAVSAGLLRFDRDPAASR